MVPDGGTTSGGRRRTARDIMTPDPVVVGPDLKVTEAAVIMLEHGVGALPVLDGEKLIGIVTAGDLIAQRVQLELPAYVHMLDGLVMYPPISTHGQEKLEQGAPATVREAMTSRPLTVSPEASVEDVAALLVEHSVGRVLVAEEGGPLLGIVAKSDVVRAMMTE